MVIRLLHIWHLWELRAAIRSTKQNLESIVRVVGENEDSTIQSWTENTKYKYIAVLIGAFCCALAGSFYHGENGQCLQVIWTADEALLQLQQFMWTSLTGNSLTLCHLIRCCKITLQSIFNYMQTGQQECSIQFPTINHGSGACIFIIYEI